MAFFGERYGYETTVGKMEPETITDALRSLLWNVINTGFDPDDYENITFSIWHRLYKKPVDTRPVEAFTVGSRRFSPAWQHVRQDFFSGAWYRVYGYLEIFVDAKPALEQYFNAQLSQELAPYRILGGKVVPITDESEVKEISTAIAQQDKFSAAGEHLAAALKHLSEREHPDYRNSVKESVCAVESAAAIAAGLEKVDFGRSVAMLEKQGKLTQGLKSSLNTLYGWSSDSNGVRHAMLDKQSPTQADAKFFLIICSAFVNYMRTFGS